MLLNYNANRLVIYMKIIVLLKKIYKKLVLGNNYSSDTKIAFLRKKGIQIGEGSFLYDPSNTIIDIQNPKCLKIGNKVHITSGVKILTHDYSWSVIADLYGECVGGVAPVIIGNNVFIGVNTVILKGTEIGDNTIIGAGSVVSGVLEKNSVYAGNPARRLMSIEDFYKKKIFNRDNDIKKIIDCVENEDDFWNYLREYSTYIVESPNELIEDLLINSSNYDKTKDFYLNNQKKKSITFFKNK